MIDAVPLDVKPLDLNRIAYERIDTEAAVDGTPRSHRSAGRSYA